MNNERINVTYVEEENEDPGPDEINILFDAQLAREVCEGSKRFGLMFRLMLDIYEQTKLGRRMTYFYKINTIDGQPEIERFEDSEIESIRSLGYKIEWVKDVGYKVEW